MSTSAKGLPISSEEMVAIVSRDSSRDGDFYYGVVTTKIFCSPSCPSKSPKIENVVKFEDCESAKSAGFRACKRCKPEGMSIDVEQKKAVARICQIIESSEDEMSLEELAKQAGYSSFYFHKMFKRITGITPKAYSSACKKDRVQNKLSNKNSVTETIYASGFNSNGRFYEKSNEMLGMTPTSYKNKGKGTTIKFAIGECIFGPVLVAATEAGICAIYLDDDPNVLSKMLQDKFPNAEIIGADREFEVWVAKVIGFIESKEEFLDLPLDIQGSIFQKTVWQALCKIPVGETVTYTDIAERIGKPKSVRAVANAIGSNNHAIAIPCHRVVRRDGSLSGYRWGVDRKEALLRHEHL